MTYSKDLRAGLQVKELQEICPDLKQSEAEYALSQHQDR